MSMDTILAIAKLIDKIAVQYPLGPLVVLASVYYIYDGIKSASTPQISFAAIALIWSLFTVYAAVIG